MLRDLWVLRVVRVLREVRVQWVLSELRELRLEFTVEFRLELGWGRECWLWFSAGD